MHENSRKIRYFAGVVVHQITDVRFSSAAAPDKYGEINPL
jgi:hypothetical protein